MMENIERFEKRQKRQEIIRPVKKIKLTENKPSEKLFHLVLISLISKYLSIYEMMNIVNIEI